MSLFQSEIGIMHKFFASADIDQLITITGMVTRTSHLVPELSEAFFRCSVCKSEANVEVQRGRIAEPTLCPNCNTGHSYALVHNRCQFQVSVYKSAWLITILVFSLVNNSIKFSH